LPVPTHVSIFYLECPANFVPVLMRQTGMRGAFHGTRNEAHAGADCELVAAEVAVANGKTTPLACREGGIPEQTYYR